MSGHRDVYDLLQQDAIDAEIQRDYDNENDDDEYVYDIYCLDDDGDHDNRGEDNLANKSGISNNRRCSDRGDADMEVVLPNGGNGSEGDTEATSLSFLDCELHNGVGYWDEQGNLVLDHVKSREVSAKNDGGAEDEDDNDDADSNDEGWGGNDYPEDEEDDVDLSEKFYDMYEDDDELLLGGYLRGRHQQQRQQNIRDDDVGGGGRMVDHDDDGDGMFDAAYGICDQNEPEYELEAS